MRQATIDGDLSITTSRSVSFHCSETSPAQVVAVLVTRSRENP